MSYIKSKRLLTFIFCIACAHSAHADFYHCTFTEPFLQVLVSTKYKMITLANGIGANVVSTSIQKIRRSKSTLTLSAADDLNLTIDFNKTGNDGMSDLYYPYEAKLDGYNGETQRTLFGGCENEAERSAGYKIERIADAQQPNGLAIVNFWPGEYGYVFGFKPIQTLTLKPGETYSDLLSASKSKKSCTLQKGKLIVDSVKQENEKFVNINGVRKFKYSKDNSDKSPTKSSVAFLISYIGEGSCLIEHSGKYFKHSCPTDSDILPNKPSVSGGYSRPKLGKFAFLRCSEGHFTWVPYSAMSNDRRFEAINLGF